MVMFLLVVGALLFGFGAIITITAIPGTSWDVSWPEVKRAFRTMAGNLRFQIGFTCAVIGF